VALSVRRRLRAIAARLRRAYGDPPAARHLPPIDELVLTILSQNTSDVNRDRAYADLRRAFPTWTRVAAAPARSIARAIRRGGLSLTKAPRIKATLRSLADGGVSLDDARALAGLPDAELWDLLLGLPGVGPKTAACVLLFSLDRPHFPVDTHVHRVAIRLGLVPERAGAVQAQATLQAAAPPEEVYALHMGLIRHGREVCVARRPYCSECVLRDLCPRVGVMASR
jgi:endonuclease-3